MTNKKIETLTAEQEALLPTYRKEGIKIGLATGPEMDEKLVREITDEHRVACGLQKAKVFKVYDSPFAAIEDVEGINPGNALYGQHDINWLSYYKFMDLELGVTGLESYRPLYRLATMVGWMWFGNTTTIVTRRPAVIHMLTKPLADGETIKVLHNYNGMSLEYADGTGVYTMNGTRIPAKYADLVNTAAEELDVKSILKIKNTEIRTEFLKKVGIEKAFESLDKKKLDANTLEVGGKYELFSVAFGENTRHYLRGKCPSNQEPFFEAVPPTCNTVNEALAFRNGVVGIPLKLT